MVVPAATDKLPLRQRDVLLDHEVTIIQVGVCLREEHDFESVGCKAHRASGRLYIEPRVGAVWNDNEGVVTDPSPTSILSA
jgi:hypothetical protein